MTKKDYDLIGAAIIAATTSSFSPNRKEIAKAFAQKLSNENPKFDVEKFYKCCGIENGVITTIADKENNNYQRR